MNTSVWSHQDTPVDTIPRRPIFQCTHCSKRFTQKRVLQRHLQEQIQPRSECSRPYCDFKWVRFYPYERHLKEEHKLRDDEINKIRDEFARCRRNGTRVNKYDPPPYSSPPPIEFNRQSLDEPQQFPRAQILPLFALGEDTHHASPPPIPSVAYNVWPGHAEPITTTSREDASELKHLAATHAPSRCEGFALLVRYSKAFGFKWPIPVGTCFLYATYIIDSILRFLSAYLGAPLPPIPHQTQR